MTLRGRNLPPPKNRRQLAIALDAINSQVQRGVRPRVNAPISVAPVQPTAVQPAGQPNPTSRGAIGGSTSSSISGQGGVGDVSSVATVGTVGF